MQLGKLLEDFKKSPAVDEKIISILNQVQRLPETKEELISLIRFVKPATLVEILPDSNIDAIHMQLKASKQVLVATQDWYYI